VKEREGTANKIIESYVCPFVHPLSHLWVGGLGGSVGSVVQWLNTNFPTAMANAVKCDSDAHEPARQCIHKCARVLREGHFVRGFHFAYAQWLTKCNICMWGVPSKATCIISEINIITFRYPMVKNRIPWYKIWYNICKKFPQKQLVSLPKLILHL